MDHETRSEFTVRSYEVDSYAHLNNSVYVNWFEQGRLDWLLARGFSYDAFAERRQWFVVARTEVDFRAPLGSGDRVLLTTRLSKLGRSSVRFAQRMLRHEADPGGEPTRLVCEAATVMAFCGEGGGAIFIPDDFRKSVEPAP